jgi:hypothetical protein
VLKGDATDEAMEVVGDLSGGEIAFEETATLEGLECGELDFFGRVCD